MFLYVSLQTTISIHFYSRNKHHKSPLSGSSQVSSYSLGWSSNSPIAPKLVDHNRPIIFDDEASQLLNLKTSSHNVVPQFQVCFYIYKALQLYMHIYTYIYIQIYIYIYMYTHHKSNSSCSCKSSLRTGKHRTHTHTHVSFIFIRINM